MTNPLTDRLTHTASSASTHIATHVFVSALHDIVFGRHTVAQVKNFFDMTTSEQAGFDAIVNKLDSASLLTERRQRIGRVESILLYWSEGNITGYTTASMIEDELLDIDSGPAGLLPL
jgi:hypothetical protein